MRTTICIIILLTLSGLQSGCVIMDVGVSNPIPEMTRVAIIPFVNLSSERAVDGRRFAEIYYSELQKVPGFQVIPVGVVETAMVDYGINLDRPEELMHLIEILDADAAVFGAVTEYSPYKPPRLGLQVSWYTNKPFTFDPGLPIDPGLRKQQDHLIFETYKWKRSLFTYKEKPCRRKQCNDPSCKTHCTKPVHRGQSPSEAGRTKIRLANFQPDLPIEEEQNYVSSGDYRQMPVTELAPMNVLPKTLEPQPIMSYTRIYDAGNADFLAALRDYVELNGDLRSGGYVGWTQRSDDFIRFCMHRMVVEMLQLHGGESKRRIIFANRRQN